MTDSSNSQRSTIISEPFHLSFRFNADVKGTLLSEDFLRRRKALCVKARLAGCVVCVLGKGESRRGHKQTNKMIPKRTVAPNLVCVCSVEGKVRGSVVRPWQGPAASGQLQIQLSGQQQQQQKQQQQELAGARSAVLYQSLACHLPAKLDNNKSGILKVDKTTPTASRDQLVV